MKRRVDGRMRVGVFVPTPRSEAKRAAEEVDDDDLRLDVRRRRENEHPWRQVAVAILAQAGDEALSGRADIAREALAFLRGEGEFAGSVEVWAGIADVPMGTIRQRFAATASSLCVSEG